MGVGMGAIIGTAQPDMPCPMRGNLRRAFKICGKISHAPQDVIGVEYLCDGFNVAEAVLKREDSWVVRREVGDRADGRRAEHAFGHQQHKIDRPRHIRCKAGPDPRCGCAAIVVERDPFAPDDVKPRLININHRYIEPARRQPRRQKTAHGASADNHDPRKHNSVPLIYARLFLDRLGWSSPQR